MVVMAPVEQRETRIMHENLAARSLAIAFNATTGINPTSGCRAQ